MTVSAVIWAAVAAVGGPGAIWAFAKKVWPLLRKLNHFIDDWFGEGEREGRPAQPGVLARLQSIEQTQLEHTAAFEVIRHELFPNSGSSLRDSADRSEKDIADIKKLLTQKG